jgi:hypothetical protein
MARTFAGKSARATWLLLLRCHTAVATQVLKDLKS